MPSSLRLYPDQPILLIHVCGVSHIHSLSSPSIVATRAIVVTWWTLLVGPRSGRSNNGSVWWVYSSKRSTRRTGARTGRRSAGTSANQACGSTSFIFADVRLNCHIRPLRRRHRDRTWLVAACRRHNLQLSRNRPGRSEHADARSRLSTVHADEPGPAPPLTAYAASDCPRP